MASSFAKLLVIFTCLAVTNGFIRYSTQSARYNGASDPGDPLILTKYIKDGKSDDGKHCSFFLLKLLTKELFLIIL